MDLNTSPITELLKNFFHNLNQQVNYINTPMLSSLPISSTLFLPNSMNATSSTISNIYNTPVIENTNVEKFKRRTRLNGKSAKTAEVWRFFTKMARPEQASICSLCQKIIKTTNSRLKEY